MDRRRQTQLNGIIDTLRRKFEDLDSRHMGGDADAAGWLVGNGPEVAEALRRVKEGTYGECADCNGRIPLSRLRARPEAVRCVQCQSRREQQGGPRLHVWMPG
jgi:hypothetical protein